LVDFGRLETSLDLLRGSRIDVLRPFRDDAQEFVKTFFLVREVRITSQQGPVQRAKVGTP
jgi:hypothetical protein